MRLTLKHQIILAPAAVLLLMALLLGFLQYTYWDLSRKRQDARNLGTVFVALAEAELATQRMHVLLMQIGNEPLVDVRCFSELEGLHDHLEGATGRILALIPLPERSQALLRQVVSDLNPERGIDVDRFNSAIVLLRPELNTLSALIQRQREKLRGLHSQDIDELVAHTAFVSIVVLGSAILVGILLSMFFGRSILRRIKQLSDSAGRIARGELTPPPAPARVRDELDALALSINHMTDRLLRVVGTEKLLEGAEEERRRIAMDIHDQTLSDLASVLRGIQEVKSEGNCGSGADRIEEDLQRAISNLREVMDNLHPQTLDILGLGPALESHLERHLAKGDLPTYHLYVSPKVDAVDLSRTIRLALYRIALEAVHNVIKHAGATRYEVNLDRRENALLLSVEDNGRGFDPSAVPASGHRGLYNIRERAKAIGADVGWGASRFSSGTRFELTLPLPSPDRGE
ncbi:HAMP domain-containing protein [Trichloromonas sp.]|uniref:sensor histidine kinase n=1 Tax=Trichloromonas sp. TaxID=3069249 RepID=UPI003D8197D5